MSSKVDLIFSRFAGASYSTVTFFESESPSTFETPSISLNSFLILITQCPQLMFGIENVFDSIRIISFQWVCPAEALVFSVQLLGQWHKSIAQKSDVFHFLLYNVVNFVFPKMHRKQLLHSQIKNNRIFLTVNCFAKDLLHFLFFW